LIVRLAGFDFDLHPAGRLVSADLAILGQLGGGPLFGAERAFGGGPWIVSIEERERSRTGAPDGTPAAVSWEGGLVRATHRDFDVEIDPERGRVALARPASSGSGLSIALRVALACRLPLAGGLPLHAAGLAADGEGVVFFGPSGAGKSTIAALSPYPVFSDELVVLAGAEPFEIGSSGFWGTFEGGLAPRGFVPLRALVELQKAESYRLTRLSAREALLRLMDVVTMPAAPSLWRAAMPTLRTLIESMLVYRMAWSPRNPPWEDLRRDLADGASRTPARESASVGLRAPGSQSGGESR